MSGNLVSSRSAGLPQEQHLEITPHQGGELPVVPAEQREEGVNWGRFASALKRYKWLMLAVSLVGTALGALVARFMPLQYSAEATLWVQGSSGKTGPIQPQDVFNMQGYGDLLKTDQVFAPVIHRLKLYIEPKPMADTLPFMDFDVADRFSTGKFELRLDEKGQHWTLHRGGDLVEQGKVGDSIGTKLGWHWVPTAKQLGAGHTVKFLLRSPADVTTEMGKNMHVSIPEKGAFIRVGMTSKNKFRVAGVVNGVTEEFLALASDLQKRNLTELRILLDSQTTTAQNRLRDAETRLKTFQTNTITQPRNGVLSAVPGTSTTGSSATAQYFALKAQLDQIRQDRQQLETILVRAKGGAITVDAFTTVPSVNNAAGLKQALSDLTKLESEMASLLLRYTPEHPLVKQTQTAITVLNTERIPALAQALIDQLKSQEGDLQSRIGAAGTEIRTGPEVEITELALTREYKIAEQLYQNLAGRLQEARLAELSAIPDIKPLDPAVPPSKPMDNQRIKIILLALFGSIGGAIALALLLDQLDKRFRYPEQVSSELGLTILGAIPAIKKSRKGELAPEQAAQVVEAFRTVRLNLAHSYGAAGPVTLTISSPGAGDGKSLVSSNLAVSFAEAGYRTLLIDGDIRRGEIHRMFGVDRRPGLLDFLTGTAGVEEIIRQTSQRGLSVVPCGTRRHQGPELLGSSIMADLMAQMKTRFQVIIVDSPPLGAGIDPFVLGTLTGHMMLVFRSGETDRQMAEAKLRLLDRLPVRVLGAVLNEIQADGVYRYYSYLYGYTADEEPGQAKLPAETGGRV